MYFSIGLDRSRVVLYSQQYEDIYPLPKASEIYRNRPRKGECKFRKYAV